MQEPKKQRKATPKAKISLETVIDTVSEITDLKQIATFLKEINGRKFTVTIDLEIIQFVKDFMVRHALHQNSQFVNAIVTKPGDDCDPRTGCDKIRR